METLAGAALNIDDYLEIRPMNDWMQEASASTFLPLSAQSRLCSKWNKNT